MLKLLLVRHGETTWNAEHRLQGDTDVPMSDAGRRQVRASAAAVGVHRPDVVVSSPLRRTRETARLLGHPVTDLDAGWAEAHLGQWAGRLVGELRATGPDYDDWRAGRFTPPGGEGPDQLAARVLPALAVLRERTGETGTALVVTHGGPVRAVLRHLLGLDPTRIVPVAPASLTVLELDGCRTRLAAYNVPPVMEAGLAAEAPD